MSAVHTLAPATSRWIESICRRFGEATGWGLDYVPEPLAAGDEWRWSGADTWSAAIQDGQRRAGRLQLERARGQHSDRSWLAICELAELIAELINRATIAAAELNSRTHEVSTLIDIGMALAGETNLFRALSQLLRGAVQLTGFHSSAFFLLDPASRRLNLRAWHNIEPEAIPFRERELADDPPDLEALGRGLVWITRDSADRDCDWLPQHAATGCGLVVQTAEGPMGTLWALDRRRRVRREADVQVLSSIAAQVAAVLERLVLRTESAAGHRLRQDVRLASEYQHHTAECTQPPADPGFDIATLCASRYELGGDLCEVLRLSADETLVAVGDASGDSVPAAMLMAGVRGALRALVGGNSIDPRRSDWLMSELNRTVCGMTPAHQFMSLWLGVIDTSAGTLTHTNAGHPCPLVLRRFSSGPSRVSGADAAVEPLESHGMLLGILPEAAYGRSTIHLALDDVLLAFSDGVTEAMDAERRLFGTPNVIRAAYAADANTAAAILRSIHQAVERHIAWGGQPDDRTLLVVRGLSSC
jgi:sigma-B regulation protein RsbU (phosphoserine phosphatase)